MMSYLGILILIGIISIFVFFGLLSITRLENFIDKTTASMKKKAKEKYVNMVLLILAVISVIISSGIVYTYYITSVLYKESSDGIATRGIILKEKILLSQYRLIGERDYLIFKMNEYTRSDREFESILVIKND